MVYRIYAMGRWSVAIAVLLLPSLVAGQFGQMSACGEGRFRYTLDGSCTDTVCPGDCFGNICCVPQCFDFNNAKEMQTHCMSNGSTSCSGFEEEMQCVADLYNTTKNICQQQAWLLSENSFLIGLFDPRNCPCDDGYVKMAGDNPALVDICNTGNLCYNVTDSTINTTVICLNASIAPDPGACAEYEQLLASVVTLTFQQCVDACPGTCRNNVTGELPSCCLKKTTVIPRIPEAGGGDMLHVGYVVLIVVVVIIFITFLLFGVLYCARYRKLMTRDQQQNPNFTDMSIQNSAV